MAQRGSKSAAAQAGVSTKVVPNPVQPRKLPLFKVLLHNDDQNTVDHVVETIVLITPLNKDDATQRMLEAHESGCALLLVTHKERAELYVEQFHSRSLTVSIEPAE